VKATYTADVMAPSELTVLMGAVKTSAEDGNNASPDGLKRHTFTQKIPIPSYLIAMVTGKLESKRIGPRTTVWAEKEFVESGTYEFEDADKMLVAQEKLMGE